MREYSYTCDRCGRDKLSREECPEIRATVHADGANRDESMDLCPACLAAVIHWWLSTRTLEECRQWFSAVRKYIARTERT